MQDSSNFKFSVFRDFRAGGAAHSD